MEDIAEVELLNWYFSIQNLSLDNAGNFAFGINLNEDAKKINMLISLRGKLMMALLKDSKN